MRCCRRGLAVVQGTFVGCLRLGLCIPALLVIVTHSLLPPIGSVLNTQTGDLDGSSDKTTQATPEDLQSGIFVLLWSFVRLFLEVMCCLLTIGDTLVTTAHPSVRPASPHSFLSLLGLPRWMLRALFAIIVTASYSCRTSLQISAQWSEAVATVYSVMPALSLLLGVLVSLLGVLPVCTHHPWLGEASREHSPLVWKPHRPAERNRPTYREMPILQRVKLSIETVSALCIPCFVTAVASFTLYRDLSFDTTCPQWQSVLRSGLHILLSLVTAGLLLYQIRTNSKVVLPAILRLVLLYLMSGALSICDLKVLPAMEYYLVHVTGLVIMLVMFGTYLVSRQAATYKEKFDECIGYIHEFFSNFKSDEKQLRCLQTLGLLFAMVGVCFAVVALPLTWYRVEFHPEKLFKDFIAAKEYLMVNFRILEAEFDNLLAQLKDYVALQPVSCEELLIAGTTTFILGLFPFLGAITSVYNKAKLVLRQVKMLSDKALSARREVTSAIRLLDNAGDVIKEAKRPLLIGLTTANFGLVAFLLPVIATGTVAMVVGFWPRRFAPELREDRTQPYRVVRGLAILILVLNVLGLVLFESWAPQFSDLAGSLPLLEAELIREPACALIDCAFVLSILASVIFLAHAQLAIRLHQKIKDEQDDLLDVDEEIGVNLARRNTYTDFKLSQSTLGASDTTTVRSRGKRGDKRTASTPPITKGHLRLKPAPRGRFRRKMSSPLIDYNMMSQAARASPRTPPPRLSTPPRTPPSGSGTPPTPSTPPTSQSHRTLTLPGRNSPQNRSPSSRSVTLPLRPNTRPRTPSSCDAAGKPPCALTPPTDQRTPPSTPPPRFPTPPSSPIPRQSIRKNNSTPTLGTKPSFRRTQSPLVTARISYNGSGPLSRSRDSFSSDDDMSISSQPNRMVSPDLSFARALFGKKMESTHWSISESSVVSSCLTDRPVKRHTRTLSSCSPVQNSPVPVRRRHKSDEPPKHQIFPTQKEGRLDDQQPRISLIASRPPTFQRSSRLSQVDQKARRKTATLRSSRSRDSALSVGLFGRVTAYVGHMERIPPRGWCLSLVLTAVAMLLAFQSMSYDWVTFGPVLKPKWTRLFAQMTERLKVLEKLVFLEFRFESDFCGLLTSIADLRELVPVIFVKQFNQTAVQLIQILEDPSFNILENDLLSGFQFTLQYTVVLAFLLPTFFSFLLVFVGFTVSFSRRASSYFPAHELKTWLNRMSLFVILNSCNTVFVMLRQLQSDSIPIYNLHVTIRSGFAFGIASQCFVLLVVVVLSVEIMCPPDYYRDEITEVDDHSMSTLDLENIPTPTIVGNRVVTRTTRL